MPPWKSALLHLYYYGGYPYRRRLNVRRAAEGQVPVAVLFYHRIADDRATSCTTSNHSFARQIRWLAKHFDLISLEEAQRRITSGRNSRPSACITFDDGYSENYRQAIPLLISEKIPCTYFVTLQNLLSGEPFEHDTVLGHNFPPNTLEQVKAMAAAGIEIGAHTYSHADIAKITDQEQLYSEVVTSGRRLQAVLGRPVRYFAFPFGLHANLSTAAFEMARDAGYEAVCSAYGGYNFPGDDPFHLQRIHGDEELIRLKNRATVDPRKIDVARFDYDPSTTGMHCEVG